MTDDAKNLLRECLQYLYESAPAEVYDRITAHLAAPAPEPVAWAYLWPEKEEPEFHRVRLSQESRNARQKMKVIERPLIYADAAPADQWRRVEDWCKWSPEDAVEMPDTWRGDCGILWTFTEGGPHENGVKFCHNCGKQVALPLPALPEGE